MRATDAQTAADTTRELWSHVAGSVPCEKTAQMAEDQRKPNRDAHRAAQQTPRCCEATRTSAQKARLGGRKCAEKGPCREGAPVIAHLGAIE